MKTRRCDKQSICRVVTRGRLITRLSPECGTETRNPSSTHFVGFIALDAKLHGRLTKRINISQETEKRAENKICWFMPLAKDMGVGRESRGQAAITGSEREHVIQRQCTAQRPRHCSSGNRISTFLQLTTPYKSLSRPRSRP